MIRYNRRCKEIKAVDIQWDVQDDDELTAAEISAILERLPTEIDLPDGMEDEDEIGDYLSDMTGFCHFGFDLEK